MSCYVVLDTNVLVSALLTSNDEAATVQVVTKLLAGEIVPLYSNYIIEEYKDVLNRKKFGLPTELVDYLVSAIEKFGILVENVPSNLTLPDMKDVPFYEIVLEKREDNAYLVTGNKKHFPKQFFVVTPREFLDILKSKN